ncbi:hypothetical protein LguiB_029592 [Lonicera macranthoides]
MDIQARIGSCDRDLFRWEEELCKKFKKEISQCRERIDVLINYRDDASQALVLAEKKHLIVLLQRQTEYWKQRSKIFWLRAGDTNSKVFHRYASTRRSKNIITSLINF